MSNDSGNSLAGMLIAVVIAIVAGLAATFVVAQLNPPPWNLRSIMIAVAISSAVAAAIAYQVGSRR